MAREYSLRKTKGGPRMMTLSPQMEQRLLQAPADAVRLTLSKAFEQISLLTGDAVVLLPEQQDRLTTRLSQEPVVALAPARSRLWTWMVQGARYADTQGMAHFLDLATEMVVLLDASVSEPAPTSQSAKQPD